MKSAGERKKEFLYYRTESWENYEIGESSFYQGQRRYIFEKTSELVGEALVFRYKLGGKCRFGQKKYTNWKMAGVSLRGKAGEGICFGAGRGKLQVTGREQILIHAPEISIDAVQKIGQYNELLKIIDTSNDYDTFVRRLNNWANYRLKGGVEALPEGLQIK